MFAPLNLLVNLCREIATLTQSDEKHTGKNVDQYALRIGSLFTRLLAEAARTTPPTKSAQIFAWERQKIVVFENRLLPSKQIREDPANLFASARDRARKHASNNLHGVNATNLSSVVSTPPPLKNQLETRLDDVQVTIASLVEAPVPYKHEKRGRSKSERQATQGRRDNSASKRERSSSKAKATRSTRPHCMHLTTHKTEDCLFAKLTAKIGTESWQSPVRCVSDRVGSIATVSTTATVTTRYPSCPVVTTVGTEGTNTVAIVAKADGRSTTTGQNHLSEGVLTPQRSFATLAKSNKHWSQQVGSEEMKYDEFFRSSLRHYQSAVLDVFSCSTRFPPTSVRIPGVLEGENIEHQLTIDFATDIPRMTKTFIDNHEKLRNKRIFPIPPGAISLQTADATTLEVLGCIRYTLKLGNKSLPVEALVLPHLGADAMLIDNSVMKSFRAKLDWAAERLSFQDTNVTIPATHTGRSLESKYCSVIAQTSDEQSFPVWVSKKYVIPAAHEALIRFFSTARPQKDTLALIAPKIG